MMQKCKDAGEKSPVFVFDLFPNSSSGENIAFQNGIIYSWKENNFPDSFRFP